MSYNTYSTCFGETYSFEVPVLFKAKSTMSEKEAAYCDSQLNLYDKDYNQLVQRDQMLQLMKFSQSDNPQDFRNADKMPAYMFPNHFNFSTQESYIKAMSQWYKYMLKKLKGISMPYFILSKVYFPSRASIVDPQSHYYRKFDETNNPLRPKNMEFFHRMLLSDDRMDLDQEFPDQLPKRTAVKVSHQVTLDPQWQGSLIVKEPNPLIYESFDDYLLAYESWHKIACLQLSTPPIPPDQFSKLLRIDKNLHQEEYQRENSITHPEKPQMIDYSWVYKTDLPQCKFDLNAIINAPNREEKHESHSALVFGVDKDKFVKSIKKYGLGKRVLKSQVAAYPFTFIRYPERKRATDELERILYSLTSETSFVEMIRFIYLNYDLEKFRALCRMKHAGTHVYIRDKIADCVNPYHLHNLFEIAENSQECAIRVAHLLSELTSSKRSDEYFEYIINQRNSMEDLYRFTRIACLLANENLEIYKPPTSMDFVDNWIYKMHYAQILTEIPICDYTLPFSSRLIKMAREYLLYLMKWLDDTDNILHLWESLNRDTPNQTTYEMYIFAMIQPEMIIQKIFKNEFFQRLCELSRFQCGRLFLVRLIFSGTGKLLCPFLRNKEQQFNKKILDQMNQQCANILSMMLQQYRTFINTFNIYAPVQDLTNIVINTISNYKAGCNLYIKNILKIITNKKFISPKDIKYYDSLIGSIVCQICIESTDGNYVSIEDAVIYISKCLKYQTAADQVARFPDIISYVLSEMSSKSIIKISRGWKFWRRLTTSHETTKKLLKMDNVSRALIQISSSENPMIFMNYCMFLSYIAENQYEGTLDFLLIKTSSTIGRFACTCKLAPNIFNGNKQVIREVDRMIRTILRNDKSRFKADLSYHLNSLGVDLSKYV